MDVPGQSDANETVVTLWDCSDGLNQVWVANPAGELRVYGTKCLDAKGEATANGTAIQLWMYWHGQQTWRRS